MLLKFVSVDQAYPTIRPAAERAKDFNEIYLPFDPASAQMQSSRCSQCGIPFCQVHCPLQNNIPDWLKLTAEGRLEEAYHMASLTNSFPEICGRICPQDKLCEGNCVIERGFKSVTIGTVEKYITDTAWEQGWIKPFTPRHENGLSVGIIGAGPAGLAAAEQLRRKGYAVHLYDRHDRAGGLLIYGIPNFKLDKAIVERRRALFEHSGIQFHLGKDIAAKDFTALQKKHDAVLIATGVYKARPLQAPGSGLPGIVPALDYLIASNRKGLGDAVPAFDEGTLNAAGKKVVVVGGGDTAMDCVRTAIRQGAASVTCLYRRDRDNMPGSAREVAYAEEEGVTFSWLSAPKAFLGDAQVSQIRVQPMRLGPADASGRRLPEPIKGKDYVIDADLVIAALGFEPEALPQAFGQSSLTVTENGTLTVDAQWMTSLPGVFAAGDIVRGASLVVWAIAEGRKAALSMDHYIRLQQRKSA